MDLFSLAMSDCGTSSRLRYIGAALRRACRRLHEHLKHLTARDEVRLAVTSAKTPIFRHVDVAGDRALRRDA